MTHWQIIWTKPPVFLGVYFREEKQIEQSKGYWDYREKGVGILNKVASVGFTGRLHLSNDLKQVEVYLWGHLD